MNQKEVSKVKPNFGLKGWIVLIYMFLVFFLNTTCDSGWQNVLNYFQETFGWNATTLMTYVSVGKAITIVTAYLFGRLLVKSSARRLGIACGVVVCACAACMHLVGSMWLFILFELVITIAQTTWAWSVTPVLVANFFPKKKSMAMGIVTIGIPLGAGTTTILYTAWASAFGYQYSFMYPGLVALIALVLLVAFVRDTPEKMGYSPDNDPGLTTEDVHRLAQEAEEEAKGSPWTTGRIISKPRLVVLGLVIGLAPFFGGGVMGTLVTGMLEWGTPMELISVTMLTGAFGACFFSYVFGILDAKFGARVGYIVAFLCAIASGLLLSQGMHLPALFAGVILVGAISGGSSNFMASLLIDWFGASKMKGVYAVILPLHQLTSSLGNAFFAQVDAAMGGYEYAALWSCALMAAALVVFVLVSRNGKEFVQKCEQEWAAQG